MPRSEVLCALIKQAQMHPSWMPLGMLEKIMTFQIENNGVFLEGVWMQEASLANPDWMYLCISRKCLDAISIIGQSRLDAFVLT